jgi:citrate synthase
MRTSLGHAELDRVLVRGHDLTGDLLGRISFGEMTGLILLGRRPSPDEGRMIDALLVVLVEHGLVKPVVVARFVYSNAPESLQAAVAASLMGAGSRHLGSSEWAARLLQEAVPPAVAAADTSDEAIEKAALAIVDAHAGPRTRIAGIGHRTHAGGDPRAVRLFEIARDTGTYGTYCRLLERVATLAGERRGRPLPVNVTGAIAAIASDMGFRWEITRGFALIARTLGSLGHLQEEMAEPLSDELIRGIAASVPYEPDAALGVPDAEAEEG